MMSYNSFIEILRKNDSLKISEKTSGMHIKPKTISNMMININVDQSYITLTGITKIILVKRNDIEYANLYSGFRRVFVAKMDNIREIKVF